MSNIIRNFVIVCLCCFGTICQGQTLHKLSKDLPQVNKEFQFNVYVVLDSLRQANFTVDQLDGPIESANQMFSPIGVSFAVCKWDTIHDYNFDRVVRGPEFDEMRILWKENFTINLYIVEDAGLPLVCAFASLGGIAAPDNAYVTLGKTCPGALTHELGHLMGLEHTFEGNGTENVDGSNCETAGDGICDTPADPYDPNDMLTVWQNGCEFVYQGLDANGEFYQPDMGNVMSYYGCDCGFTHGQYVKMANTFLNSSKKVW